MFRVFTWASCHSCCLAGRRMPLINSTRRSLINFTRADLTLFLVDSTLILVLSVAIPSPALIHVSCRERLMIAARLEFRLPGIGISGLSRESCVVAVERRVIEHAGSGAKYVRA